MVKTVYRSSKRRGGYTILEVLIALVIFAVTMLGLYYTTIIVYKQSTSNLARKEAVSIAQEELERIRTMPFQDIKVSFLNPSGLTNCDPNNPNASIERQIRNTNIKFGKYFKVIDISPNLKEVTLTVCWKLRGKDHKYQVKTIVRNEGLNP